MSSRTSQSFETGWIMAKTVKIKTFSGIYRFAGVRIRIETFYEYTHHRCRDYRAEGPDYDFEVRITQTELDSERYIAIRRDLREGIPEEERAYPEAPIEFIAVCRRIAERLPEYGAVLVHGSCVAVDGEGYLFIAKSGVGKSTHTRLWCRMFGGRAEMINDDKPIVSVTDGGIVISGSPWAGKDHLNTPATVPLKGISALERAEKNKIVRLDRKEAYDALIRQIFRPSDAGRLKQTLALADEIVKTAAFWRLSCNLKSEAALVAYEAMKGETEDMI